MNDRENPEERYAGLRIAGMLSTIGLTLAISIGIGVGLGVLADCHFYSRGIGVIIGVLLGIGAGFQQLIRVVIRANREEEETDAAKRRAIEREK